MPNARIEIEHVSQVWTAEVEVVTAEGARRANLRSHTIEDLLDQVYTTYRERVPVDETGPPPVEFPPVIPVKPPERKVISREERGQGYPRPLTEEQHASLAANESRKGFDSPSKADLAHNDTADVIARRPRGRSPRQ